MTEPILTTQQQHVLALLAQGNTVGAAAKAAGVHRNTVSNWRRAGSSEFRNAWQSAQLDQAAYWRDHLQLLGEIAVKSLLHVLQDPKTTPSVRLKASLAVLNVIATPAPAQKAADLVTPELHIPELHIPELHIPELHNAAQPRPAQPTPAQPSKVGQAGSPAHATPQPDNAPSAPTGNPAQSCTTPPGPLEQFVKTAAASGPQNLAQTCTKRHPEAARQQKESAFAGLRKFPGLENDVASLLGLESWG
jgi:hypothetical protein